MLAAVLGGKYYGVTLPDGHTYRNDNDTMRPCYVTLVNEGAYVFNVRVCARARSKLNPSVFCNSRMSLTHSQFRVSIAKYNAVTPVAAWTMVGSPATPETHHKCTGTSPHYRGQSQCTYVCAYMHLNGVPVTPSCGNKSPNSASLEPKFAATITGVYLNNKKLHMILCSLNFYKIIRTLHRQHNLGSLC